VPDRKPDDTAPENHNSEQDDEPEQTQSVTDDALHPDRTSPLDSEKHHSAADLSDDSAQDLVDHMRDMEQSGRIDMLAFEGEDNHDDNEDKYGPGAKPDPDLPSDGS
jgi:hypothetical protein